MAFRESDPIGVFDSGLGGLTILKALQEFLPYERFIYFGDTAHLPYGEKSADALVGYVHRITRFLHSQNCKHVVVACNSASTVLSQCTELPYSENQIHNVIQPIVELIGKQTKYANIGIIGTRKTILSGMFDQELKARNPKLNILSRSTPLLVPMIEEGFSDLQTLKPVFDRYFQGFEEMELIIPACTHYPLIYQQIESYFNHSLKVLHTPKIIAETVKDSLDAKNLLNTSAKSEPDKYHLSDLTDDFKREAEMFLGRPIELQKTLLK